MVSKLKFAVICIPEIVWSVNSWYKQKAIKAATPSVPQRVSGVEGLRLQAAKEQCE